MSHFVRTIVAIVLAFSGETAFGQNCGCAPNLCCSQFGYCGTSDAYCGSGCQSGPCHGSTGGSIANIVTYTFFNGIANRAGAVCPGKGFYTRSAFLTAAGSYPGFGRGASDVARREIAAFFAHVTHETGSLCYIEEINGASRNYCDINNRQYPCVPARPTTGEVPFNLHGITITGQPAAGQSIGINGLNNPDIVATDNVISFKTALWFWMNNCHNAITSGRDSGPLFEPST